MATLGNERYLRHIWLLGEGGLLVLRGIVIRETVASGQPLETILTSKRSLFTNILREQYLVLFPTCSTVNQCVNTWDMCLLLLVIKKIFWSNLAPADQSSIGTLKAYRNNIQGHPTCLSMTGNDYDINRAVLEAAIRQLATGLSAHTKSEIQDIIQKTASGDIDIGSVLRRIKDLHEFKATLQSLENKLDHVKSTLSEFNRSLSNMAVTSERNFSETKEGQERVLQIVSNIEKINKRFIVDQTRRQASKELKTIVQAHCDGKEKEEKAIRLLYDVVELIQTRRLFSESEIKTMILQRIKWHGELTVQLIEDVISWFTNIYDNPDTSIGIARLGSILLPIKCFSREGQLRLIDYMHGMESQGLRLRMSSNMSQQLGFLCILSWSVEFERQDLYQPLFGLSKASKIVLPVKTKSVKGSQNILNKFDGEWENSHLSKISETLSDIFGAKIRLSTAVDTTELGGPLHHSTQKVMTTDTCETTRRELPSRMLLDHSKQNVMKTDPRVGKRKLSFDVKLGPPPIRHLMLGTDQGVLIDHSKHKVMTTDACETTRRRELPSVKWDVGVGRLQEEYWKKENENKSHTYTSGMLPERFTQEMKAMDTSETLTNESHSLFPLSSGNISEPYTKETKTTDTSETITRASHSLLPLHSDEATWHPLVYPFTEHEKAATKAENEDKTHTYTPAHQDI